jgi:Ca-activated chloride channel family protein
MGVMGNIIMRIALLGVLLVAGRAQANEFWSSLWRTPDQRGQQLLQQGDAKTAARTFSDPQRKAYAELKAGDYAAAARDFAAIDSSDAHYNRGNALAHAGDLQAAIKAYDAALARDPNNRDARHNRDLVAQALKQSKPPAPPRPDQSDKHNPDKGSGKDGDKGSGNGSDQGPDKGHDKGQDSGKDAGASGQQPDSQPGNKPGQAQQSGQSGSKPGQQKQAGQSGSQPGEQGQPGAQAEGKKPASPTAGSGTTQAHPASGNDAEQARHDAEASLGKQATQPAKGQAGTAPGDLAGKATLPGQADTPRSEQQLAQDQWLRQIPDDPGGLLRRKFLIEHLMRQQGNSP